MAVAAYAGIGAGLLLLWWLIGAYRARRAVYELFGVDPQAYRLIASDLGGRKPLLLRHKRIVGAADAAFVSRRGRDGLVGEYKSRQHRGLVRRRERYQLTLYMGMLRGERRLKSVRGILRYADHSVPLAFDKELFLSLVGLAPEFLHARKRWQASNATPLHLR